MSSLPFDLPAGFLAHAGRGEGWAAWVEGVPRVLRGLLDEWDLVVDGAPTHGGTAVVVPVTADGAPAVLKLARPAAGQDEGRHEILALQTWHGRGAVRLLRADPRRDAMLLERASHRALTSLPVIDACEVVAGLYARLHVPAPPQLVPLTRYIGQWVDDLAQLPRHAPVPHRIVDHAVPLGRTLAADPDSIGRLVHGDLHDGNVLAAEREPWLAIGPRPLSGDPHAEPVALLSRRWDEVVATGDVRAAVRRRFHAIVDTAGLDEDRARDWVVLREAVTAMRAVHGGDRDRVTTAVAIVKAVQD